MTGPKSEHTPAQDNNPAHQTGSDTGTRHLTPEVSNALEKQIAHWEANVAAHSPDDASVSPEMGGLCHLFYHDWCKGCPVKEKAGRGFCGNTPYGAARTALYLWAKAPRFKTRKARGVWRRASQAEVDYLKNLRSPS